MEIAMQIISNDQTVRKDTVQFLKDFRSRFYQLKPKKENKEFL